MVLLWSLACRGSEWITMEYEYALTHEIPINVFVMNNAVDSIPRRLRDRHHVKITNGPAVRKAVAQIAENGRIQDDLIR